MRIAHVADIHIRNLSRHDEHRIVFTDFVKQCRETLVEHIFVGGDVFHTKTSGMSPECIEFMCWAFRELASVCQVHVLLGNHDMNCVNLTRQDALTPIFTALNDPKIHLYKDSGVYQFAPGFNWCIFSLFDQECWDSVKPVVGDVNIACYHGPVWGASTETGWKVEDGLTIEFFNAFDLCLLGDIHKTQHLGYKDVELTIDEADLHMYPNAEVLESA